MSDAPRGEMRAEILATLDDDQPGAPPGFLLDPDDRRACEHARLTIWVRLRHLLRRL